MLFLKAFFFRLPFVPFRNELWFCGIKELKEKNILDNCTD